MQGELIKMIEDDSFIKLIQIASEDQVVKNQLKTILALDSFNRQSLLNTWIHQLELKKDKSHLREALIPLLNDKLALKCLEILRLH